eukprot:COSAG02_NODE_18472_length_936_cov_1.222222_1_plen_82_part_10
MSVPGSLRERELEPKVPEIEIVEAIAAELPPSRSSRPAGAEAGAAVTRSEALPAGVTEGSVAALAAMGFARQQVIGWLYYFR